MKKEDLRSGSTPRRSAALKKNRWDSERFRQLRDLARSGDENAVADLFKEFDFTFTGEDSADE